MRPVSPAFLQALTTSHTMTVTVAAMYNGLATVPDLPVTAGSVTVDRGSKVRRTLSLTVADPKYLPWGELDPLAVYGQTLVVSRGIRFAGGTIESVPLGTFRINEPAGDTLLGPVTLTGQSSECYIIDDKFMVPTSTRGYTTCVQAIEYLIRQTLPDAVIVNATAGSRNPPVAVATWNADGDRWEAVQQVALSMQAEIYVDALDRFVIADLPDVLSSAVVWEIAEGEGGTLMSSARTMSRSAVYNAVVASGENIAAGGIPVSAVAYDTNPNSPTRWGGPFGKVPKHISSSLLMSTGACQAAADYALFDATARNVQLAITAIPNPALEAGDCLRISHAGRKELAIAQSFTVPLTAEETGTLTLRGGKEELE
ncbi:peptidase [Streptomyces sp. NTK 937]|nr:peptidase [Streptomyces sp. NTK 937]